MAAIIDEIKTSSSETVIYFKKNGTTLNYTIESLKQIDNYFDRHLINSIPKNGEVIEKETRVNLFSVGSYLGETLIKNMPGSNWEINESENITAQEIMLKLSDGSIVWPFDRILKRFYNGSEDGIYVYGYFLTKDYLSQTNSGKDNQNAEIKKWWKFW